MWKFLIKLIWELPSNVVGFILMFFLGVDKIKFNKDKGILELTMSPDGGITVGVFVFVGYDNSEETIKHELGHVRQGWICGPLYLIVIGIPSFIWCCIYRRLGKSYDWFYTEKWLMEC